VWPTSRETGMTVVMVLILATVLSFFFLGIDSAFGAVVKWLISLAA
jgi:preprotein translocase subunit SecE